MEFKTEQAGDLDLIAAAKRKQARITALVFGAITCVALVSLIYAFVQKGIADLSKLEAERNMEMAVKNSILLDSMKVKLNQCIEEANRQKEMAERAVLEARKAQQQAAEALQRAMKKASN